MLLCLVFVLQRTMTYQQIIKDIKSGNVKPIYFLMGEETFFIDKIVGLLEKSVLSEEERSFNQVTLYGKETDVNTIVSEARRYPMMAEKVVVSVREAQNIRKIEELEAYANNPQPSTVLIIGYKYKKLDKRKKLYKILEKNHVIFEAKRLYDNQVPAWIEHQLKQRGFDYTPKAVQLLFESLGSDLGKIDNELEKLELILGKGEKITDEKVEQNIGISKDYNNFELQGALRDRNFAKALTIQKYFAQDPKNHPLQLTLNILFAFFSKLMIAHQAPDKSPRGLAATLKVNPYHAGDYQKGIKNYDLKKLARIIGYLRECDRKSKGVENVSTSHGELLRELIYKIIYV